VSATIERVNAPAESVLPTGPLPPDDGLNGGRLAERRSLEERFRLLSETAGRLLVERDPQAIVEELCRAVMTHLDCQAFFNFLYDEEVGRLRLNACAGIPPEEADRIRWLDYGVAVCGCVARDGSRIVAEDIPERCDPRTDLVRSYGILAYACHPIYAQGRVIGTLSFGTKTRRRFSEADLALMKTVTDQVAVAMERIRAEQRLRELNALLEQRVAARTAQVEQLAHRLRALTVELTQAEHGQRRRIATILHDQIQQVLAAARLRVSPWLRQGHDTTPRSVLARVDEHLQEALATSRGLVAQLSPPVLHDLGLVAGLNWLAQQVRQEHGLSVVVEGAADAEPRDETLRLFLFHAARELLKNVVKHAGATQAVVRVESAAERLRLTVEDDGRGFEPPPADGPRSREGGLGLFGLRERLSYLGGETEIDSAPGRGARIVLHAPASLAQPALAPPIPPAPEVDARPEALATAATDPGETIRVLIADAHEILRQGLAGLLRDEPGIEIVGEASNGREAIELARRLQPAVVVMDVSMPEVDGIEATRAIRRELPSIAVVGLSMHERPEVVAAMRTAGACSYLTKGGPSEDLVAAIRGCARPRAAEATTAVSP